MRDDDFSRRQFVVLSAAVAVGAGGYGVSRPGAGSPGIFMGHPRITISAVAVSEQAGPGATVGVLSVFAGSGTYTFSIPSGGDPDAKFALNGASLITADALDFESATFHKLTLEADNGVDPILSRTLLVSVTNAHEQPDLSSLSLPETVAQGSIVAITGATAGSNIIAPILPTGWTLDEVNRELTIAPDAPIGTQDWSLLETLDDSANSPRVSRGSSTVEAPIIEEPFVVIAVAGQSNATGNQPMGIYNVERSGVWQFGSNVNDPGTFDKIISDTTPLLHNFDTDTHPTVEDRHGPGASFAAQLIANGFIPAGHRVLLVPIADVGTGIAARREAWWPFAPTGVKFNEYVAQVNKAIIAAKALNPASYFAGTLMVQGERDATRGRSTATYFAAGSEFITQTRAQIMDATNAWIVWHSMTPERTASDSRFPPIQDAHVQLGAEISNSHFFQAPMGRTVSGDTLHFDAEGAELNGIDAANFLLVETQSTDPKRSLRRSLHEPALS